MRVGSGFSSGLALLLLGASSLAAEPPAAPPAGGPPAAGAPAPDEGYPSEDEAPPPSVGPPAAGRAQPAAPEPPGPDAESPGEGAREQAPAPAASEEPDAPGTPAGGGGPATPQAPPSPGSAESPAAPAGTAETAADDMLAPGLGSLDGDVALIPVFEPALPPREVETRPCLPWSLPSWPPAHPGVDPAGVLVGTRNEYRPFSHFEFGSRCMRLEVPASLALTFEGTSAIPVDRYGNEYDAGLAMGPRFRIGGRFDTGYEIEPLTLRLEYEHDLITGFLTGDPDLAGASYPNAHGLEHQLRKGFVRASFSNSAQLSLGYQTSHWGMGLIANDGDHGWQPGTARFSDPHGGDRTFRALISTGPHTEANLFAAVGGDLLDGDFLADDDVLLRGDHAVQLVAAFTVGFASPHSVGAYLVRRHQESLDGRLTDVWVVDVTGRTSIDLGSSSLFLEGETALITGTTELPQTVDHPEQVALQFGGALRAGLDAGVIGWVVDLLYASGDQNVDDPEQNAFKADPNFEMGLLLYRHVLGAQTARGAATASDPTLSGIPAAGSERIPTQGAATNTFAVFPRLRVRPIDGLEAYGGPLVAFSAVPLLDPFNSRLGGGTATNALDGSPSNYLGLEWDLGLRYRALMHGSEITAGVEGGMLLPGGALVYADGTDMGTVLGLRGMLGYRL